MDHVRKVKNKVLDFQAAFQNRRRRSSSGSVGSETEESCSPVGTLLPNVSQALNFPSDSGDPSPKSKASVTLAQYVRRVDPSQYYRNYPCGNDMQIRDWDTW